jgi:formate dehydrogenase assembly factor FdhD
VVKIDAQLASLPGLSRTVTRIEQMDLDSKSRAAALPASRVVEKLVRYETSNDRELDRALKRLEQMQERRRATGGTHPTT